jgi:hypothetical protein
METWTAVHILKFLMDVFAQLLCNTLQIPTGSVKRIMPFVLYLCALLNGSRAIISTHFHGVERIQTLTMQNVWKVLKLRVQRQTDEMSNAGDLQRVVHDIWSDLHLHYICSIYRGLPRSLEYFNCIAINVTVGHFANLFMSHYCTRYPLFALDV